MSRAEPYALLDSGSGRKLERLGQVIMDRQASAAWWRPCLSEARWREAHAFHHRDEGGGGHWEMRRSTPEHWTVEHGPLLYRVQLTPFGHCGLFPEHEQAWERLAELLQNALRDQSERPRVLHLFAYTGGGSLRLARAGADITHVDSAKGIVSWARENVLLNQAQALPIRWIVEDAARWVEREEKRGRQYDAILLDPPSFGRGSDGEVWKIDDHLVPLLEGIRNLLSTRPLFVHLSSHTPGLTALGMAMLLQDVFGDYAELTSGELRIPEGTRGRSLPAGSWARIEFKKTERPPRVSAGPATALD